MNDKEILKKQLINHFITNWLIFVAIFTVFGIMVIILFNTITYKSLDEELKEESQIFLEEQSAVDSISNFFYKDGFFEKRNELNVFLEEGEKSLKLSKSLFDLKIPFISIELFITTMNK